MTTRIQTNGLSVHPALHAFVEKELLLDTGVTSKDFWAGVSGLVRDFSPKIRDALQERSRLQSEINKFLTQHRATDVETQTHFLRQIGYIEEQPSAFSVTTGNLDPEICQIAGPQLVVPVNNARYALNAVNARWGSLYDALYGTDAIPQDAPLAPTTTFNPQRGRAVVRRVRVFLDETVPLAVGSHDEVRRYYVQNGKLHAQLPNGQETGLSTVSQFAGYTGSEENPERIVLVNNGLHIELRIDRSTPVGSTDPAGISDVQIESALSTIMDFEDSVAAVDAVDKVLVYRNWLGLMRGTLLARFARGSSIVAREMNKDRSYTAPDGSSLTLSGRSLLLVRTVGHHMFTDAILDGDGREVPEGVLDAIIAAVAALHDLRGTNKARNSATGSVYIVRPKMHGSKEIALSREIFAHIEDLLALERNTLKMGIMDEERRTSVNLAACIREAKERAFFINTGFLDRTGDEIHTCMRAGPVIRKGEIKNSRWIKAYEQRNVAIGLAANLGIGPDGHGQVGKGMWAMPDRMNDMIEQKGAQLRAGASTAWVPSPTAATLHALHYHATDVATVQNDLSQRPAAPLEELLTMPLAASDERWSEEEIMHELDTNLQSILGYVARWVDMGVGCSKVPDLNDVGLMEDRATLRISSQHVSNWLMHGIVTEEQVERAMARMARLVDEQNRDEPGYVPLSTHQHGPAYLAARDLVFAGAFQPNGYTEAILHTRRREAKAQHVECELHLHEDTPLRYAG